MSMLTRVIDERNGLVMPWLNRGCLDYLKSQDITQWDVFEWGTGFGTLWWSKFVKSIVTVDHTIEWNQNIKQRTTNKNVIFKLRKLTRCKPSEYTNAINENLRKYDCIIIDGRNRDLCGRTVLGRLKPGGIIILDNSEREKYRLLVNFLNHNFTLVNKFGIDKKVLSKIWETTLWQSK
jgi:hypothetical protein